MREREKKEGRDKKGEKGRREYRVFRFRLIDYVQSVKICFKFSK